tara:strand:- start:6 stop:170 length:165 start_codon:yes stop_codon:yes gene_type:complete
VKDNKKIPKQLDIIDETPTQTERCKYAFVFSNDINDWIVSKRRIYDEKSKKNKK